MVQPDRSQTEIQHGACSSHTGQLRLQTHTQNMKHLLLFPGKDDRQNARHCYERYMYC